MGPGLHLWRKGRRALRLSGSDRWTRPFLKSWKIPKAHRIRSGRRTAGTLRFSLKGNSKELKRPAVLPKISAMRWIPAEAPGDRATSFCFRPVEPMWSSALPRMVAICVLSPNSIARRKKKVIAGPSFCRTATIFSMWAGETKTCCMWQIWTPHRQSFLEQLIPMPCSRQIFSFSCVAERLWLRPLTQKLFRSRGLQQLLLLMSGHRLIFTDYPVFLFLKTTCLCTALQEPRLRNCIFTIAPEGISASQAQRDRTWSPFSPRMKNM